MAQETKKRKATYLRQKEEQEALQAQLEALQQQMASLRAEKDDGAKQLYASVSLNAALREAVEQQHLGVATAQSMASQWLQNQTSNPMGDPIHLGREWMERRETLLGMRDERLARGYRYVTARCQYLDALKPHFSEEKFEDTNGEFCCVRNEVIPFPGVQSMRKVFDALKFTLNTLEICVSEQLGHITVRDDYDTVGTDSFVSNYRLASGLDSGVTTELNSVAFGQYFKNVGHFSGGQYAVLAIDSVDEDKLHPYHPQDCIRKVLHGTMILLSVPRRKASTTKWSLDLTSQTKMACESSQAEIKCQTTEMEIVMLRSFFVKTCRPEFEVSQMTKQELRDNITRWGDVVLQAIRRIIYA
ncbi:unnamed protein product [Phytophthora lilii]|uniref:Unnamed protein product n=1 Tax=Phytophthora lilii TaxID=2077276 RepID=A0A9W6UEA7_9STRA|nr:unnamed protein product [Phytophthora lilii]